MARYAFEARKRREIENLLKKNMRIKTTPTKSRHSRSRNRTPVKINFGTGMAGGTNSVVSGGGFSNKPTNVFSNAPSTVGLNIEPVGRMATNTPAPTFTPTKQVASKSNLAHFYDEILTIEQLLDLTVMIPPSYPPSAMGTPRPASGFTSLNATPTKAAYSKAMTQITDFGPYLTKRAPNRVDFNDVEEGLRKKLIGWDQIEFKREVFDQLNQSYSKY
jgi:hypothetical protein